MTAFTLSRFYDRYNRTDQIANGRYVYRHASIDAALWHISGMWAIGFLADIGMPSGLLLVVTLALRDQTAHSSSAQLTERRVAVRTDDDLLRMHRAPHP
jgi:hypothetical protein